MCDRMGISGMHDFICPYSITYAYDASIEAEREKLLIAKTMQGCHRGRLYFALFNTK